MTAFQIIIVALSFLGLVITIIGVSSKVKVDIAKVEVEIQHIKYELINKETSMLRLEDKNSIEHQNIMTKIETILLKF